jgi:uncharacterized protein YgbK (DUF1537 family)
MSEPIIVLADDLTGATELAGVALRFGFRAEVLTQAEGYRPATDRGRTVVCYDTDTRRLSAEEAAARTHALAAAISAAQPCLFKKTDSLLRGHPTAEIEALLRFPRWRRALLCPANPGRGRTIERGDYYVGGTPLAQSSLADDPEHPRTSSNVYALLGSPRSAIEVPDAASTDDLRKHASQITADTLPAGGAEFFAAMLRQQGHRERELTGPSLSAPWCLVCGSRTGWHQGRHREATANDIPCLLLDDFQPTVLAGELKSHGAVWLAIGEPAQQAPARYWLDLLASKVSQCVRAERIGTLFLEGGATARAVLDRCGWARFEAVGELAPGCVAMRASDPAAPLLVTKPGSYPWPDSLWQRRSPG